MMAFSTKEREGTEGCRRCRRRITGRQYAHYMLILIRVASIIASVVPESYVGGLLGLSLVPARLFL